MHRQLPDFGNTGRRLRHSGERCPNFRTSALVRVGFATLRRIGQQKLVSGFDNFNVFGQRITHGIHIASLLIVAENRLSGCFVWRPALWIMVGVELIPRDPAFDH